MILMLPTVIFAQTRYGVKAGYNNSDVSFGYELDRDFTASPPQLQSIKRHGFYVGIFSETKLSRKIYLQSEVVFSQKGYQRDISLTQDFNPMRQKINHNEITIPISISYELSKFEIGIGHELGFKLNDSLFEYHTDLSVLGTMSFNFNHHIAIDVRYAHGYKKLFSTDLVKEGNSFFTASPRSRVVQLGLSYKL